MAAEAGEEGGADTPLLHTSPGRLPDVCKYEKRKPRKKESHHFHGQDQD